MIDPSARSFEWPTFLLALFVYFVFITATTVIYELNTLAGFLILVVTMTLHSSLTHEVLHGHPFKNSFFNAVLVFPQLSLWVPYLRFKGLHLDHHRDECLTDPHDDPKSNFLDLNIWSNLPLMIQNY
jgi:fatty acid desaturase